MKVQISASDSPNKKYDAIFYDKDTDYTLSGDEKKRAAYIKRHSKNEDFNNPMTAGSLSRWILWGDSTNIKTNISAFKKRFNLG